MATENVNTFCKQGTESSLPGRLPRAFPLQDRGVIAPVKVDSVRNRQTEVVPREYSRPLNLKFRGVFYCPKRKVVFSMDMLLKIGLLVIFFAVIIGVGFYWKRNSTDVSGFVLGGLIIVPIVSLFTPKPKKEDVDAMFECYQKDVIVKSKEALGE